MKKLLLMLVLFTSIITCAQNVAINNDASLPDNSAILDIKSGTKGLLIPRMNTAAIAGIVNPAKGLLVLDTAKNQLLVNMGTPALPNWQTIVASSGWGLTGNSGIDSITNFIGTTNTKPFIIRVNNARSGYLDTITNNTSFGFRALDSLTTGRWNTAMGFRALSSNKSGNYNTSIGWNAMFGNTIGIYNTAVGPNVLFYNTTGNYNTAIGAQALNYNSTGSLNTASGYSALNANMTGNDNSAFGINCLGFNIIGSGNSAFGRSSSVNNYSGNTNTAMGILTLYSNSTGNSNVAIGAYALYNSFDKSNLVAVGDSALFNNGTGATLDFLAVGNTAIGSKAMFSNTTGYKNTAIGFNALRSNTDGSANIAIGSEALSSNTYASSNTAIGWESLKLNTTGDGNTAIGYASMGNNNTGSLNTSYGFSSLYLNMIGQANSAHGYYALVSNTSGNNNTSIGYSSLISNTIGSDNTGIGNFANVANGNLTNATSIGSRAMVGCNNCMVLGSISGVNGAIGTVKVGIGTTTPINQLEVVGPASANPVTLMIANRGGFGPAALEFISDYSAANQWRPGYIRTNDAGLYTGVLEFYTNGSGAASLNGNVKGFEVRNGAANTLTGAVGAYSDARLKNNITAFTDGLNVVNKISPVQFYYNTDAPFVNDRQQVGVIAQDLEKIAPYMVEKNKQNGYEDLRSVNNQAYTFLLINAVKEQQQQIETSKEEVKQLKAELAEIKKIVEQLVRK